MIDAPTRSETVRARVRGVVQGVGFRPFVYRLAQRHGLAGWVLNDPEGVLLEASGQGPELDAFLAALAAEAPPAARVEAVEAGSRSPADPRALGAGFAIRDSQAPGAITTLISPDLAVCDDCLAELFDPDDPRYRYPYINCTNCGPRYSIIESLPYDRPRTTMKGFALCEDCARAYHDPLDRRFHAQPVACPRCGPDYRLVRAGRAPPEATLRDRAHGERGAEDYAGRAAIAEAARMLAAGAILAVKGLGGYHLACDASDAAVVEALRKRKFRKEKPFALMARDAAALQGAVVLGAGERALLEGPARPIVLLPKGPRPLPDALAPGNPELGVMLPYTPLHHLLFDAGAPPLLVMTSANRSSEPIAYRDVEALTRLDGLADAFLIGDRPIQRRVDDSVLRLHAGLPLFLRRARGYAPAPVARSPRFGAGGAVLALGAGMKSTITLATGGHAFTSQHLGDLDNLDALEAFEETVRDLGAMYGVDPEGARLVHDLHPDYGSSRFARALARRAGASLLAVQHHRAHIASVLAERAAFDAVVLGFSFDGTGLGEDGTIWGGEIFGGSIDGGLERIGHLRPARLPGGDAAARRPEQAAVGFLYELDEARWGGRLAPAAVRLSLALIEAGERSPVTTSAGRLFDAVAALLGFHRPMTFEGQAAMWLEGLARAEEAGAPGRAGDGYPLPFDGRCWDTRALLSAVLDDLEAGVPATRAALRFHRGLAEGVAVAAAQLAPRLGTRTVVLSGGVWQNRCLHRLSREALTARGLEPWWNTQVSPGDGGISLGQAALAVAGQG